MKTIINYCSVIVLFFLGLFLFQSCEDENDNANLSLNNFVWKGLNVYYLWQDDVPNLSDTRFDTQKSLNSFLANYAEPETLFESLLYKPESRYPKSQAVDRFSWMVKDYRVLEAQLQGTSNNNGVEFELNRKFKGSSDVIGWVRYILPDSDAATKNIKRGDIFYGVNGTPLTVNNYQSLLFSSKDEYTLNLANYKGGAFTPNGKTVLLTKKVLNENPIFINKVLVSGPHKIGYLMYNGFYANYDTELNAAFGTLKSEGITDLVLDLRYNGGGSILTATRLASMITGSFTGKVFAKEQWNPKIESYFAANDPESLKNYFVDKIGSSPINNVKMSKVYILTSKSSASASELVINGLKPHINVIQIGDITVGKNVGSVTLYDSSNFGKEGRNPSHRYAMQPLVLKIVNSEGFGDYQSGLVPTHSIIETLDNLGVLGDTTEPLLNLAIEKITGKSNKKKKSQNNYYEFLKDSKSGTIIQNQMYIEKAPEGLLKALE